MILSILTATYNRADYLTRLYESIVQNQKKSQLEAEWIIIDDGSTDKTKTIVKQFISNKKINIKYMYQQNSGKMVAINKAVEHATGDLIVDCDSDDIFSKDAFNIILHNSSTLFENNQLYTLCFLKQDLSGKISGKCFKENFMQSTMFDLYFKHNIEGEKILVFNSEIRKKYEHELENGEKFVTEARMYHKMDEKYKVLCINEAVEIGDYRDDGYTKNISDTFKRYPNGYYKYFKEILHKDLKSVLLKKKIYIFKHFLLFLILKLIREIKLKDIAINKK